MTSETVYAVNRADAAELERHLRLCDADFVPPLSGRVDLAAYASKLANRAQRFEAWHEGRLVACVAAYFDGGAPGQAHVSNVSVLPAWTGRGLASRLLEQCIEHGRRRGMKAMSLEVARDNSRACRLYRRSGFEVLDPGAPMLSMRLILNGAESP